MTILLVGGPAPLDGLSVDVADSVPSAIRVSVRVWDFAAPEWREIGGVYHRDEAAPDVFRFVPPTPPAPPAA